MDGLKVHLVEFPYKAQVTSGADHYGYRVNRLFMFELNIQKQAKVTIRSGETQVKVEPRARRITDTSDERLGLVGVSRWQLAPVTCTSAWYGWPLASAAGGARKGVSFLSKVKVQKGAFITWEVVLICLPIASKRPLAPIWEQMHQVLLTTLGERIMQAGLGCDVLSISELPDPPPLLWVRI